MPLRLELGLPLHPQAISNRRLPMKPQRNRPPFFGLLLRATIWTPVAVLLTVVRLTAIGATFLMPILGILWLCLGDYLTGCGYLLLCPVAFFIARFMTRKFWEAPSSLL